MGANGSLEPNPHFPDVGETAYGVAVSLEARNEALQAALTWLGRQASSASFREIGREQAEGRRTPAVARLEAQYSDQAELEEKLETSATKAKTGIESALEGRLKQAFGYDALVDSDLFPEITEEKVKEAFLSGGPSSSSPNGTPGHREGKKEFEGRFKGSNHRNARHAYRQRLKSQSRRLSAAKRRRMRSD